MLINRTMTTDVKSAVLKSDTLVRNRPELTVCYLLRLSKSAKLAHFFVFSV